jgi:hypothetical protein
MKSALISPIEDVVDPISKLKIGVRVCEVVEKGSEFEVHPSLYWMDCGDEVEAFKYYLSDSTSTIELTPIAPIVRPTPAEPIIVEDIVDGQ